MNITVKYFASLREQLGKAEELLTLKDATPISRVWQNVSGETTSENILMAINMEYVKSDAIVNEGDEVAFLSTCDGWLIMPIEIRTSSFNPWMKLKYINRKMDKEGQYGATASFVGTMRDFNEGESVRSMTLEHYPGMTEKHLEKNLRGCPSTMGFNRKPDYSQGRINRDCGSNCSGLCLVCTPRRSL